MSRADTPVFGSAQPGIDYRPRPSVYALLTRADGRIAVMRVDTRAFLPGGGAAPGESFEDTIRREVLEEMGWSITAPCAVAQAVEYLQPTSERLGTRIEATFVWAVPVRPITAPVEADHRLEWLEPAEAVGLLTHRSHSWIADQAAQGRVRPPA